MLRAILTRTLITRATIPRGRPDVEREDAVPIVEIRTASAQISLNQPWGGVSGRVAITGAEVEGGVAVAHVAGAVFSAWVLGLGA